MKFYNPFKWHIVEYRGQYAVRKLSLFGFVCKDTRDFDGDYLTGGYGVYKHCLTTYEKAKEMIESKSKFVEQ